MGLKIPVFGTLVEWSDDDTTFTKVPGLLNVVIPDVSQVFDDVTDLDSADGMTEYQKGLKDTSEEQLEAWFSEALYEAATLKADLPGAVYFRITMAPRETQSTGNVVTYRAFVNPSIPSQDMKAKWKLNIKLRPTGGVAFVQGAAL